MIKVFLLLGLLVSSVLPSDLFAESAYIYIGGQVQEKIIKPVETQAKNTYATGLQIGGYILVLVMIPVIIYLVVSLIKLIGLRIK